MVVQELFALAAMARIPDNAARMVELGVPALALKRLEVLGLGSPGAANACLLLLDRLVVGPRDVAAAADHVKTLNVDAQKGLEAVFGVLQLHGKKFKPAVWSAGVSLLSAFARATPQLLDANVMRSPALDEWLYDALVELPSLDETGVAQVCDFAALVWTANWKPRVGSKKAAKSGAITTPSSSSSNNNNNNNNNSNNNDNDNNDDGRKAFYRCQG